jgi:ribonuclease HII
MSAPAEVRRRARRGAPTGVDARHGPGVRSGAPTLREERRLLRDGHVLVAGMDEVGRGALAGPVTVGVVVVDASTRTAPPGVRDSKLLTPIAREAIAPRLRRWGVARAVGHAEPWEIDLIGIIAALRLAAWRALTVLPAVPTCILLDGSHDWLTPPAQQDALFELPVPALPVPTPPVPAGPLPRVVTRVKADLRCAAVAAASVLAKVERDGIMVTRAGEHPDYGWRDNKGYAAPEHVVALGQHGPSGQHRRSWSLPGVDGLVLDLAALAGGQADGVALTDEQAARAAAAAMTLLGDGAEDEASTLPAEVVDAAID